MPSRNRRRVQWARRTTLNSLAVPTAGVDLLSEWDSLVSNTVQAGATIARIHLTVAVTSAQVGAIVVVGVGVRDRSAIPNIAGPVSAPHDDWMVWAPVMPGSTSALNITQVIDVRSMRKLRSGGEFLNLAAEHMSGSGASITVASSVLVMLP